MAEEFTKGYDDYDRFKEHEQLYGVCDDGTIEKGVGHVQAAFTDAKPEALTKEWRYSMKNANRAGNRSHVRQLWGIGQPFDVTPSSAVEGKMGPSFAGGFKFGINKRVWTDESLMLAISITVDTLADLSEIDRDCKPIGGAKDLGWLRYHLKHIRRRDCKIHQGSGRGSRTARKSSLHHQ